MLRHRRLALAYSGVPLRREVLWGGSRCRGLSCNISSSHTRTHTHTRTRTRAHAHTRTHTHTHTRWRACRAGARCCITGLHHRPRGTNGNSWPQPLYWPLGPTCPTQVLGGAERAPLQTHAPCARRCGVVATKAGVAPRAPLCGAPAEPGLASLRAAFEDESTQSPNAPCTRPKMPRQHPPCYLYSIFPPDPRPTVYVPRALFRAPPRALCDTRIQALYATKPLAASYAKLVTPGHLCCQPL